MAAYKNARVDQPLTNLSLNYIPKGFVCDMVLTPVSVPRWTGLIASYGSEHLQLYSTRVFDRGEYETVHSVSRSLSKTYVVHNHGLKDIISERDIEEVELPFQARADVTLGLRTLLMIEKESEVATLLTTASNFASGLTEALSGDSQWSDSDSTPIAKVTELRNKIWNASHVVANAAICSYDVFQVLRNHPTITTVSTSSGKYGPASEEQVKNALGLEHLYIASAGYIADSGTESGFWGKNFVLYNKAASPMRHQRTFGHCFKKRGHESRVFVKDHPTSVNSDLVFHDMAYSFAITHQNAGGLLRTVIA